MTIATNEMINEIFEYAERTLNTYLESLYDFDYYCTAVDMINARALSLLPQVSNKEEFLQQVEARKAEFLADCEDDYSLSLKADGYGVLTLEKYIH